MISRKKEKITYIDDGRSLADMSNVSAGFEMSKRHTSSPVKEIIKTYFGAMKMTITQKILKYIEVFI